MPTATFSALACVAALVGPATPASGVTGWVAPVSEQATVVRSFAPPPPTEPWLPGHRGVDLTALGGQAVRADGAGRVTFSGRVGGSGVVVVAHAAGLRSTFQPVTGRVRVGQAVRAGEVLGPLANPDARWLSHCGGRPCLHWGMVRNGIYLDPLAVTGLYRRNGPDRVRLLPIGPGGLLSTASRSGDPAGYGTDAVDGTAADSTDGASAGTSRTALAVPPSLPGRPGPPSGGSGALVASAVAAAGLAWLTGWSLRRAVRASRLVVPPSTAATGSAAAPGAAPGP